HCRSHCRGRCGACATRHSCPSPQRTYIDSACARSHVSLERAVMTITHHVRVYTSEEQLPREEQLAWKLARLAADPVEVERDVVEMTINRIIDNAAVAA